MIQEFSSTNTLTKQQITTANQKDNKGGTQSMNALSSIRANLQHQYDSNLKGHKTSSSQAQNLKDESQSTQKQIASDFHSQQTSLVQGNTNMRSINTHLQDDIRSQMNFKDELNIKQNASKGNEKYQDSKANSQLKDLSQTNNSVQMGSQVLSPKHSSSQMSTSLAAQMNLLQATTGTAASSTPHGGAFSSQGLSQNSATTGGGQGNLDEGNTQKHQDSQQSSSPTENERFLKVFSEMNEKAIESMNKDEPETSLEFLKKAEEYLKKLQQQHKNSQAKETGSSTGDNSGATRHSHKQALSNQSLERSSKSRSKYGGGNSNNNTSNISGSQSQDSQSVNQLGEGDLLIDPNYKASLYYNLACCYQRLGMLEECVDYLELATKSLNKKILLLEDEENALLFNNTDPNSVDVEFNTTNGLQNKRLTQQQQNRRQLSNHYGGCESGPNSSFQNQFTKSPSHSAQKRQSSNASSKTRKQREESRNAKVNRVQIDGKKTQKDNREKLLASKLHKLRYQCKFNLQLCAILSQINQHRDALIYGHKSANFCQKLVKESQLLCKRFMHQIQRSIKREQERQAQLANHVTNCHQQTYLDTTNGYNTMAPQTQLNSYRSNGNNQTMMTQIGSQGIVLNESSILNMLMQQQDSIHSQRASNLQTLNNSNYSIKNAKHSLRAHTSFGQGIAINYIKRSHNKNSSRSSFNSMERNTQREGNFDDQLSGVEQSKRSHSSQSEKLKSRQLRSGANGIVQENNFMDKSEVDSVSSHSSVTRLRIYKNPFVRDSMNESQLSRYRENSNESLERIHTFSLKNTFQKIKGSTDQSSAAAKGNTINDFPENKNKIMDKKELKAKADGDRKLKVENSQSISTKMNQKGEEKGSKSASLKRKSVDSSLKRDNQEGGAASGTNKTYYVEESVKILESIIMQADPILSELASKVKQFEKIQNMTASERDSDLLDKYGEDEYDEQRKKLNISFHGESEINEFKFNTDFKMSVRNVLGLRHSDDWIFNLNIGNVMHLSLMGAEELNAKLENTHELGKDSMLEKIVLVSVAYFCIGTEMRFLMSKQNSSITKKDSEAYHAKALHISTIFLPPDCPLVTHIVNSYIKNYLKDKKPVNQVKKQTNTADHSHTSTQAQAQLQQLLRPKSRQQQLLPSQQKTFSPNIPSKQQTLLPQNKQNSRQPQHQQTVNQVQNDIQPFNTSSRHQQYLSSQGTVSSQQRDMQAYQSQMNYQNPHQNVNDPALVGSSQQRASRGKQHQPSQILQSNLIHLTQQQQIQQNHSRTSGSLGTIGAGTDSHEDSNSNPHSTDARANRVLATQLNQNYAVPRPHTQQLIHPLTGDNLQQDITIQKQNKIQNQPIQGQGGQPLLPSKIQLDSRFIQNPSGNAAGIMTPSSQQQARNQIPILMQQQNLNQVGLDNQQLMKKIANHPQSTKNANKSSNLQQAMLHQFQQQAQSQQQHYNQNTQQMQNLSYQRFINCRPSLDQNSEEFMIQNYVDIDLSGDISSLSAQGISRHQFNDQQMSQQQQQQLNNQLLQQQMQQLQLQNQVQSSAQSQMQSKPRQQVKSQLNQISQIQMTNLATSNQQQQIPANYNQLQAQVEFSQFSNQLSLRHNANAKTPSTLINQQNHIQFSSGSSGGAAASSKNHGILGQNISINAFNTIDAGVSSNQYPHLSTKAQFSNLLGSNQFDLAGGDIHFSQTDNQSMNQQFNFKGIKAGQTTFSQQNQQPLQMQPTTLLNPKKKLISQVSGAGSAVRTVNKQKLNMSNGGTTGGTLRLVKR